MSLMGILSGRVFGKTGAVWVCGALFLCAAGAVRMEMAEEIKANGAKFEENRKKIERIEKILKIKMKGEEK